jgi:co-chaperonin GroES (HSP10)
MFKPVNRYIQIKLPEVVPQTTSGIVLPDDYKPTEERHVAAEVVAMLQMLGLRIR